jgi:threonine/homoserine/homoserine lactone efflux protein
LGCTAGIVPHLVAATLGLAALLHTRALLFQATSIGGFVSHDIFAAGARGGPLSSARIMRWLNRSFAAFFAALAGRLALERI